MHKAAKLLRKDFKEPGLISTPVEPSLLVHQFKDEIVAKIRKKPVVSIIGPTGCGKTTQVPQMVLDSGLSRGKMVAITQPRRIAAISLAKRVAEERGETIGEGVGYAVRFEECISPQTKLKFVTDGLLLKEVQSDKYLSKYSVVIMDEVHERTLNTDLLLSVLCKAGAERNSGSAKQYGPLKVVIMSATLDMRHITNLFPETDVVSLDAVGGVPVKSMNEEIQIFNLKTENAEYVTGMISKICELHAVEPIENHMLGFVPGREEISTIVAVLKSYNLENMVVLPLYAALSHEAQLKAISEKKEGHRRVVISTNIAETSLTIPGVTIVFDSGYVKRKVSITQTYESLQIMRISKAEAFQRSGRAGREPGRQGTCYRFYTNEEYNDFYKFPAAEIEYANISKIVLMILGLGETHPSQWPWLQQPNETALALALFELKCYGAITSTTEPITLTKEMGRYMAFAPVDPKYAALLMVSIRENLFHEASAVLAILSSEPFLMQCNEAIQKKREVFYSGEGDLVFYYKILTAFRASKNKKEFCHTYKFNIRALQFATKVRKQLYHYVLNAINSHPNAGYDLNKKTDPSRMSELLRRLFVRVLPYNVAILDDDVYRTRRADRQSVEVKIHPNSCMIGKKPRVVHYLEIIQLGGSVNYINHVGPIESHWVPEEADIVHQHDAIVRS